MSINLGIHSYFTPVSFCDVLHKAFDAIYIFVQLSGFDIVLLFLQVFELSLGAHTVGMYVLLVWRCLV